MKCRLTQCTENFDKQFAVLENYYESTEKLLSEASTTKTQLDDQHWSLLCLTYQNCVKKLEIYLIQGSGYCSTLPVHHLELITERQVKLSSLTEHLGTLSKKIEQFLEVWKKFDCRRDKFNLSANTFGDMLKDLENVVLTESDDMSILHVS